VKSSHLAPTMIVVVVFFFPIVISQYVLGDQASWFIDQVDVNLDECDTQPMFNLLLNLNRPAVAILDCLQTKFISNPGDIIFSKIISVLLLVFSIANLRSFLSRLNFGQPLIFFTILLFLLLPGFSSAILMGAFYYPLTFLITLIVVNIITSNHNLLNIFSTKNSFLTHSILILLLQLTMSLYVSWSFFYFTFLLVFCIASKTKNVTAVITSHTVYFFVNLFSNFLIQEYLFRAFKINYFVIDEYSPISTLSQFFQNIESAIRQLIFSDGLYFWFWSSKVLGFTLVVLGLLIFAIFAILRCENLSGKVSFIFCFIISLGVSALPLLLTIKPFYALRSFLSLQISILMIILFSLRLLNNKLNFQRLIAIFSFSLILSCAFISLRVNLSTILISTYESKFLSFSLKSMDFRNQSDIPTTLNYIPPIESSLNPRGYPLTNDYFGLLTTRFGDHGPYFISYLLKVQGEYPIVCSKVEYSSKHADYSDPLCKSINLDNIYVYRSLEDPNTTSSSGLQVLDLRRKFESLY
jgi:hypothetical protein